MKRGRLRVLLGMAPGVGKTYEMLEEGRRLRDAGVDVVVAVVETHGREATAAQIADLPVVPPGQDGSVSDGVAFAYLAVTVHGDPLAYSSEGPGLMTERKPDVAAPSHFSSAGFGGTPAEIERLAGMSPEAAVAGPVRVMSTMGSWRNVLSAPSTGP